MNEEDVRQFAELLTKLQETKNARIEFSQIKKFKIRNSENVELIKEIMAELDEMGIDKTYVDGYQFLVDAIEIKYEYLKKGKKIIKIMDIYLEIAAFRQVTSVKVIRDIKEVINMSYFEKMKNRKIAKYPNTTEIANNVLNHIRLRQTFK